MRITLIQANGNNVRLGNFFKQPKYELFFKGKRIIDYIIENSLPISDKVYISIRRGQKVNFNSDRCEIIWCDQTFSRMDTLKQCFDKIEETGNCIIHDCDTIINSEVLNKLERNSLVISNYKMDGKKYGFIELDSNFKYIKGNEKITETGHVSIGAYCVKIEEFKKYLEDAKEESMLEYYNTKEDTDVIYSKEFLNLGDINSYLENLWLL
jgi:choline kinase